MSAVNNKNNQQTFGTAKMKLGNGLGDLPRKLWEVPSVINAVRNAPDDVIVTIEKMGAEGQFFLSAEKSGKYTNATAVTKKTPIKDVATFLAEAIEKATKF